MKLDKMVGHQGDTQWYSIKGGIPSNAKKLEGKTFIAKSERSGNVHALSGKYNMYELADEEDGGFLIECLEDCKLNHTAEEFAISAWDTNVTLPPRDHRMSTLKKGIYYVGIQNRFDPLEAHRKRVQD